MGRAPCCEKVGLKKGKWAKEEDEILASYIKTHGEGSWRSLPKKAGLLRCGKSCRLRWINYLRPGLKKGGNFSKGEEDLIIKLHANLGNKWSRIASELPGRTDNCIKNYWNSYLSRSIHSYQPSTKSTDVKIINSDTKSEESLDSSHKNSEKNAKTMAHEPTNKPWLTKSVDRFIHPQNLTKHCKQVQNELSSVGDVDAFNGAYSPLPFVNSQFPCTTDELNTLKEEITNVSNWPCSPITFVNSEFSRSTDEPKTFQEEITNTNNWFYNPITFVNSEFPCTTGELNTLKEEITNVTNWPYSPITFVNSEFSRSTDEPNTFQEEITNSNNWFYNPITFVNSEFPCTTDELSNFKEETTNATTGPYITTTFVNSEFSCTTDEPSIFKKEITNAPISPDLSTFFKEMEDLLNLEIKELNPEQTISDILGDTDDDNLLFQSEARMDEEGRYGDLGYLDPSWDLDLWSS